VWDKYFKDTFLFEARGFEIFIADKLLAEALKTLPKDRLEIVLLYYFLGMSGPEIAAHLNLLRRTAVYRRTSSLQELILLNDFTCRETGLHNADWFNRMVALGSIQRYAV